MGRRPHSWRRVAASLAGAALVVGVAAGTTAATTTGPHRAKATKTTTITLAHWSSSPVELKGVRATIQAFERRYPSIKVNEINLDPYAEGMLARFAARKPPDIFYVDSNVFPDWVSQGVLEPISDDMAKAHMSTKPFYPRLLNAFRYKGKLYGLPKDWSPLAMQVDTTALAAANVTPPKTWAGLTAAAKKLKAAGQPPVCLGVDLARILAFMYQNGGGFLNATKTKAIVNSSQNLTAVTTYLNWIQSGLARTPQQLGVGWCGEALGKEKASIIFEGNWVTSYMTDTFPTVKWRAYPLIGAKVGNKYRGNLGFTASYSIAKDSKNKAAAFKMLRFLELPIGQRIWISNVGYLPSRSDVKPPAGRAVYPKEAPYTHPWQFAPGFSKVYDTANNELQAAFEGKETVDVALRNIQAAATAALKRGGH
jgi:multiple sugar transport system substrate-binding protein